MKEESFFSYTKFSSPIYMVTQRVFNVGIAHPLLDLCTPLNPFE